MRKNPYYKELRELIFTNLLATANRLDLKLDATKRKAQINELFTKHKRVFAIDICARTLKLQKNRYSFYVDINKY